MPCNSSLDSKQQFASDCISLICCFAQYCNTAPIITSTNCPHTTNHHYQLSAHNKSPVTTVLTQITSTNCPHTTNHQYQLSAHNQSPVLTVRTQQVTSTNCPHTTSHQYQLSAHNKSPVPTVRTQQITSTNCPHTTSHQYQLSAHNLRLSVVATAVCFTSQFATILSLTYTFISLCHLLRNFSNSSVLTYVSLMCVV
jgi:hypothetical protein